ncbi:unnamed protein product [Amoebophrya sp. A25]|nr:unnamed protein product [Amoebophrya sp. A25]|eukprot:GSA25T00021580001.1
MIVMRWPFGRRLSIKMKCLYSSKVVRCCRHSLPSDWKVWKRIWLESRLQNCTDPCFQFVDPRHQSTFLTFAMFYILMM